MTSSLIEAGRCIDVTTATGPDAEPWAQAICAGFLDWRREKTGRGDITKLPPRPLFPHNERFVAILEEYLGPFGARLWMWKEDDGLMLLPFDGESVDACIGALRLMINRLLIGAEQLAGFEDIGWRLAFHLGRTAYRTNGDTGSIVSADVNFMFHLGSRFLEPGTLSMTQPVQALLADRIRPLIHHRGVFESVHVYQLRDLL